MSIFELDSGQEEAWNDFVQNDANGTFFHLAGWKNVMENAFGFKTFYLMEKKRRFGDGNSASRHG